MTNICGQQCGDHQHTEPTDIQTVVMEVTHSQKACQLEAPALPEGGGRENGKSARRTVEAGELCLTGV